MLALFARFLRFGLLAWGGPVAQIAMLRKELVDEERWISGDRFNRLLAVYQVLPGPEATELAVHLGMLRGGRIGGLLAGLGFTLPGFAMVLVVASLYVTVDLQQPWLAAALLGIQLAVVALVIRAVERIGRHILVNRWAWAIGVAAALATVFRLPFWGVLIVAGAAYVLAARRNDRVAGLGLIAIALLSVIAILLAGFMAPGTFGGVEPMPTTPTDPSLPAIFLSGLKAGLLTFGGAYTAIPFVRADAVGGGWIGDPQFLDSLALSGILPAPLIIFGTFVGFLAGGLAGALAMTIAIFLPAFSFSLVLGDRLEAIVARPGLHRFLEGVSVGVVGIIAVTALDLVAALAIRIPNEWAAVTIIALALVALYTWSSRAGVPAVIAGGALLGWLAFGGMAFGR